MMEYREVLHAGYGQFFEVERELFRAKTEHQDLVIFENAVFGKVLALDGVVQTTTRDNHIYHEMLAHTPILAHGQVRSVLIIGGGDGGTLREVVKHALDSVVMVEIDPSVVELAKEHLPELSDGAFAHPRARLVFADGCRFVAETDERFDVIIVDSTDPIGPGAVLFTEAFYGDCRRCLTPGGVIVTQSGVPLVQPQVLRNSHQRLSRVFADVGFFLAPVPSYTGGPMTLGWASDNASLRRLGLDELRPRFAAAGIVTRHYSPEVHVGAFALPPETQSLLG